MRRVLLPCATQPDDVHCRCERRAERPRIADIHRATVVEYQHDSAASSHERARPRAQPEHLAPVSSGRGAGLEPNTQQTGGWP
eukprot:scaffold111856_cov64-Phaeocystis_antarctica.AAC.2